MSALEKGSVVQLLKTCKNKAFIGCLMVVEHIKPWGVVGYIQGVGADRDTPGDQYPYRAEYNEIFRIGGVPALLPEEL